MHSVTQLNYDLFEKAMACNGVLTPSKSNAPQIGNPPCPKIFYPPPVLKMFLTPLQLEMVASAFFTHGYFQQAHVHISEAIITD